MQRAYRSKQNKVIGGVCAGLAEYFDIDPVLLRIGFAVSFFVYGTGFLLYIVLLIALPYKEDLPGFTQTAGSATSDEPNNDEVYINNKSKRNLMGGIILIVIGLIFLAENFIPNLDFGDLWPLLLVTIGATTIWNSFQKSSRPTPKPTFHSQPPTFTQPGE